ncbi:hypothetical protein H3Z83_03100 [Tenacibaculum sp. S7007]|uniref:DUF6438 domain-containing protein n=1 Tax=Tenacibaculum pelagium TaxID=2759527 RepID=A0A839AP57_9FLAO|nr:DUF6438 domain-containing protein [Tenacibaculum pelagium]MBA6155511.1 hypothetical protein [Tenacibaculum pelagium]
MRYLLLSFFALTLACAAPKKDKENTTTEKETVIEVEEKTPEVVINNELILVLNNPEKVEDVKALITNSGLDWNKLIFDQDDLKIALITVPKEKVDFWVKRLGESGTFKSVEKNQILTINNIKKDYENRLISIKKTPCFGDCDVYDVSIDKEGNVIYNGIQYVLKTGKHKFKLTEKQLKKINDMLSEKDFSEFKKAYDDPRITDLPSTFITHNGKQIKIRLWKDIPDELINVHEYIEGILLDQKFLE